MSNAEKAELKVSRHSQVQSVAGAIMHNHDAGREVSLRAVGAGAVNQAVKAIAVASSMAARHAQELQAKIGFFTVEEHGKECSGMVFRVFFT